MECVYLLVLLYDPGKEGKKKYNFMILTLLN